MGVLATGRGLFKARYEEIGVDCSNAGVNRNQSGGLFRGRVVKRRSRPLAARLTRMNLMVSGAVLVIAALAFFFCDLISFRRDLIGNLDAEAQIIGENSVSALLFDDRLTAASTLKGLEHAPDVASAVLVASDGTIFAHYGADATSELAPHALQPSQINRVWSTGTHVLVARRIVFEGRALGVVYISADLNEIGHRARIYLLIASIIWLFCMDAALVISSFSRRMIALPVIALADTARLVSRDQDYSVRAHVPVDNNEIAVLVDAFNTMLTQIQERDAALIKARNQLETRVEERTAELKAANRELEAFSYTVAHDLRSPLTAISATSFLLSQTIGEAGAPGIRTMLDNLQTTTLDMGALIDNLLNFTHASTAPLKSVPVNLTAIAREIAERFKSSNPARNVEFSIDDTPEALADPGLMRIVLENLLGNSWKYTSRHDKGCIEFGARQAPLGDPARDGVVYFVRDDGAGFDPTHASHLFEPFKRLHGADEFPGTGIGLATVQRILARHGGSIWAEGNVEKGATFYFTLNRDLPLP
jgi:signal transduction histidine kinase